MTAPDPTATRFALPSEIDTAVPYSGPCAFCGGIEARHRVLDAIAEQYRAGDTVEDLSYDYRLASDVTRAVVEHWDDKGERWTP